MELLVQLWCPLEDSPNDRTLYIWGCARGECQKKDGRYVSMNPYFLICRRLYEGLTRACVHAWAIGGGISVRAWRGLRFNQKYAAKLEKKRAIRQQLEERAKQAEAEKKAKESASKSNPFNVSTYFRIYSGMAELSA